MDDPNPHPILPISLTGTQIPVLLSPRPILQRRRPLLLVRRVAPAASISTPLAAPSRPPPHLGPLPPLPCRCRRARCSISSLSLLQLFLSSASPPHPLLSPQGPMAGGSSSMARGPEAGRELASGGLPSSHHHPSSVALWPSPPPAAEEVGDQGILDSQLDGGRSSCRMAWEGSWGGW